MEIDDKTEAIMSDVTTPRYGYDPRMMFAATLASAERRARETAAAATVESRRSGPGRHLIRTLAARLSLSLS